MQVQEPIDIFLSHDWPCGITDHGNLKNLLRQKPFFEKEVAQVYFVFFFSLVYALLSKFCYFGVSGRKSCNCEYDQDMRPKLLSIKDLPRNWMTISPFWCSDPFLNTYLLGLLVSL